MTSNERNKTRQTGTDNGWKQSAYDLNKQIKDGKTIIHDGNKTIVDGSVYYGASAAQKAIKGEK